MDKVASFTPAPWAITKGAYGSLHVGPAKLDHPGKARVEYALDRGGHDLLAQRAADAVLIAAAPKMLAALKQCADWFAAGGAEPDAGMLLAIIAEAEGNAPPHLAQGGAA
jgi:hypothetical protein